ncbi:MAG TPA: cyclic nucleotide-binding domain-containing protein [Candidatus Binatia bacterium]
MKCPVCDADLAGTPNYCGACGHSLNAAAAAPQNDAEEPKLPSGFSRTLSTDLVAKQIELRTQTKLAALVENRSYKPGEVMIRQGDLSRDRFILNEGVVEISRKGGEGEVVLNEVEPPYLLGDVAFLVGMPRTASARAKTEVNAFVVRYDALKEMIKEMPPWLRPLLTALESDIKSLHNKNRMLEQRAAEIEGQSKAKP